MPTVASPATPAGLRSGHDPAGDPARAVWLAAGQPAVSTASRGPGICSRCGYREQSAVRIADVVSEKFTGWDRYTLAGPHPLWCRSCAWAHNDPALRQHPRVIAVGQSGPASGQHLWNVLSQPLRPDIAVLIPLSRKKHLLPQAAWGAVTTDDLTLGWDSSQAARLTALRRLRRAGFNEAALAEPAPRFETLNALPPTAWPQTLADWDLLRPWRSSPMLLAIGLRATRPGPRP